MAATDEKSKSKTGSLGTHPPALQVDVRHRAGAQHERDFKGGGVCSDSGCDMISEFFVICRDYMKAYRDGCTCRDVDSREKL